MSERKLSWLDKKIAQFGENTTELLSGIHARNKGENTRTLKKKRKMKKTIPLSNPDIDMPDDGSSGS